MRGRRVAVIGAGMTKFVRRAQETGKELSWQAANAALQSCELSLADIDIVCSGSAPDAFDGVHRKGDYLADGCGAVGKPYIRTYVGGGTGVFAPIQGWYTVASGMADVALVVCEEKMSSLPAAPAGRVPHDLRQHHRTAARAEPAVDLRARDEPLHAEVRVGQARHRDRRREEQAERGRPPGGAARPVRHHGRRRPGERGAGVAGAATRRLADQRRRGGDRDGERGGRASPDRQAGVGRRRGMEPGHHVLDEPRPVLPGVRGERGAHGVRHGRDHRAAQADPRRRAVRPVRLQGAASPRGADAVRQGEGAGGRARRRDGA